MNYITEITGKIINYSFNTRILETVGLLDTSIYDASSTLRIKANPILSIAQRGSCRYMYVRRNNNSPFKKVRFKLPFQTMLAKLLK
jgi:hypothetical protein